MNAKTTAPESWYPNAADRTGQTDDERIKDITVLPPPEHLIRFFPIAGTATETLISQTRKAIQKIVHGNDDRLLVIIGPCSIHDPAAPGASHRAKVDSPRHAPPLFSAMVIQKSSWVPRVVRRLPWASCRAC